MKRKDMKQILLESQTPEQLASFPIPTKEQIVEALRRGAADRKAFERGESVRGEPEVTAPCVVCKHPLKVEVQYVSTVPGSMMIIGPGSRNQMEKRRYIWCEHCGLNYRQLPEQKPKRKKK